MTVSIDGLPISDSTKKEFWPITGLIKGVKNSAPFVIGLYSGKGKPSEVNEYIQEYVDEVNYLSENGFAYKNRIIKVNVIGMICDAPARAYLKCVKSHSGYVSCERCTTHGDFRGRVVFLETNCEDRTDVSFRNRLDPDHH